MIFKLGHRDQVLFVKVTADRPMTWLEAKINLALQCDGKLPYST